MLATTWSGERVPAFESCDQYKRSTACLAVLPIFDFVSNLKPNYHSSFFPRDGLLILPSPLTPLSSSTLPYPDEYPACKGTMSMDD